MFKRLAPAAAIIFLLVVSFLPAHAAPTAAPTNPGSTNLVACWSLDETSGTRADLYGSNNLTDNNTVLYGTGKVSNAADFERDNSEYLSGSNLSLTSFTWNGWIKLESKTGFQFIANQWDYTNNKMRWALAYDNSIDRFRLYISTNGSDTIDVIANNFGSPSTNTWYFVTAAFSSGNQLSISVNAGTPDTTSTASTMYNGSVSFYMGTRTNTNLGYFDGMIDEAIIYSRVLTTDEIDWLYNSGSGRACSDINPTPTPTRTSTVTATPTITNTPTATATVTETPLPNTATPTATVTETGLPNTSTPTATVTETAIPSTATPTGTATVTATATITATPGPSLTPSNTPEPGATPVYSNVISYGDLIIVSQLTGICILGAIFLILFVLFNTLLRRK